MIWLLLLLIILIFVIGGKYTVSKDPGTFNYVTITDESKYDIVNIGTFLRKRGFIIDDVIDCIGIENIDLAANEGYISYIKVRPGLASRDIGFPPGFDPNKFVKYNPDESSPNKDYFLVNRHFFETNMSYLSRKRKKSLLISNIDMSYTNILTPVKIKNYDYIFTTKNGPLFFRGKKRPLPNLPDWVKIKFNEPAEHFCTVAALKYIKYIKGRKIDRGIVLGDPVGVIENNEAIMVVAMYIKQKKIIDSHAFIIQKHLGDYYVMSAVHMKYNFRVNAVYKNAQEIANLINDIRSAEGVINHFNFKIKSSFDNVNIVYRF